MTTPLGPFAQQLMTLLTENHSKGNRILIIEDSETDAFLMSEILQYCGCRYERAKNGIEGIEMMRRSIDEKDPYSLVLLDMILPGMNGLQVLETMNVEQLDWPNVVIVTGTDMISGIKENEVYKWVRGFARKPVTKGMFLELLK